MLDYEAVVVGRPVTDSERTTYDRNLLCVASSSAIWATFHGRAHRLHVMRDGLVLATHRRSPRIEFEAFDWQEIRAVDLRNPARIDARGSSWPIDGVARAARQGLYETLTQARSRGDIPAHVVFAGKGAARKHSL